jgi:hypothetical protein
VKSPSCFEGKNPSTLTMLSRIGNPGGQLRCQFRLLSNQFDQQIANACVPL